MHVNEQQKTNWENSHKCHSVPCQVFVLSDCSKKFAQKVHFEHLMFFVTRKKNIGNIYHRNLEMSFKVSFHISVDHFDICLEMIVYSEWLSCPS